jgi:uncharacterized protein
MRNVLLLVAAVVMISCNAFAGTVGISTGAPTGTYYQFGQDIKKYCSSKTIDFNILESSGSITNIMRVFSDRATQYAIVQHDALIYKSMTDPKEMDKIRMVFPFYNEEIHIIVGANTGIKKLEDLAGKRVSIGKENSGNWVTANIIKAKTGLKWVDTTDMDPRTSLEAVASGELDAMVYVAGKPIALLEKMDKSYSTKIRLLNVNHPELEEFYGKAYIPEMLYPWQSDSINTYAVNAILITYDYASPTRQAEIKDLVNAIIKNLPILQSDGHPKWKEVAPFEYAKVKWPVHSVSKTILDTMPKKK